MYVNMHALHNNLHVVLRIFTSTVCHQSCEDYRLDNKHGYCLFWRTQWSESLYRKIRCKFLSF